MPRTALSCECRRSSEALFELIIKKSIYAVKRTFKMIFFFPFWLETQSHNTSPGTSEERVMPPKHNKVFCVFSSRSFQSWLSHCLSALVTRAKTTRRPKRKMAYTDKLIYVHVHVKVVVCEAACRASL